MGDLRIQPALSAVFIGILGQTVAIGQQHKPVTITCVYTGPDNQSHAEQVIINVIPVAGPQTGKCNSVSTYEVFGMHKGVSAAMCRPIAEESGRPSTLDLSGSQRALF